MEPTGKLKRVSTGVVEVDNLIQGGFPVGSIIGLKGPPGSGKSIFSLQFLIAGAKKKEKCLYINLEEPEDNIMKMAEQMKFGNEFKKYIDNGSIKIFCVNYKQFKNSYQDIFKKIKEDKKYNRVVIDSFNCFFSSIFPTNKTDLPGSVKAQYMINEAFDGLRRDDLVVLLTMESETTYNNYNIPYLVDGIVQFEMHDLEPIERRVRIPKMRWTNQLKERTPFEIKNAGIVLAEKE